MLQQLSLHHFRNYQQCIFSPSPGINLISGNNGSGKSSLLEAIYYLGSGRSFRHATTQKLVHQDADHFVLHAQVSQPSPPGLHSNPKIVRLGALRSRSGEARYKVNGEPVRQVSQFVSFFPVQVLHPESVELVFGAPALRRSFMDWGLFHVEQSFHHHWKQLRTCVAQRNALLRKGSFSNQEIGIWNKHLAAESDRIRVLRDDFIHRLKPCFFKVLERFSTKLSTAISLEHHPGWKGDLPSLLSDDLLKDKQRGFTQHGAHRFDLRIKLEGKVAKDIVSRGQGKIISYAMILAQQLLLEQYQGKPTTLLVDDLGSELDPDNRGVLLELLSESEGQTIITALPQENLFPDWLLQNKNTRMFHVEHGVLSSL